MKNRKFTSSDFEFSHNENTYRLQGLLRSLNEGSLDKNVFLCAGITCKEGLLIEDSELPKYFSDSDVIDKIRETVQKKSNA